MFNDSNHKLRKSLGSLRPNQKTNPKSPDVTGNVTSPHLNKKLLSILLS